MSKYSAKCEADEDCVMVRAAKCAACAPCGGPAIARTDYERYQRDYDALGCRAPTEEAPCAPCKPVAAPECRAGRCMVPTDQPPPPPEGDDVSDPVGVAGDETPGGGVKEAFDGHRVASLDPWTVDCDAIDRVRKAKEHPEAKLPCPMVGDFDADRKPDRIEPGVAKLDGKTALILRWGDGTFSILGGGRRVLLQGAPLSDDPDEHIYDESFETMEWIADARVVPLRAGKLRWRVSGRELTVDTLPGLVGDAIYLSSDEAAGLIYFDPAADHWRFAHLGF